MDVPILKQGSYLIASIQGALTDTDLTRLREKLVQAVQRYRSRGVVIDVMALDVMDSFAARTLRSIAAMSGLLGARTVVVGISPEIAFSMVQLGLTLDDTLTGLDLEDGLAMLALADAPGLRFDSGWDSGWDGG